MPRQYDLFCLDFTVSGGEFSCVIAELFWFNAERLRKSTQISDFTLWFVNLLPKAVDGVHIV